MSYIGTEPFLASYPAETFSGNGATVEFTLTFTVGSSTAIKSVGTSSVWVPTINGYGIFTGNSGEAVFAN